MKLIAKTQDGREFFHSKKNCYFCESNAAKICDDLNRIRYNLSDGEKWFVYDYDFSQSLYCFEKIYYSKNKRSLRIKAI